MTYELVKQLKEAAWPQEFKECEYCRQKPGSPTLCNGCLWRRAAEFQIPTLSELIKACGDKFLSLEYVGGYLATGIVVNPNNSLTYKTDSYDSPEEAVAYLWIALNSKQ